jgi:hypothetical protein
VGSTCREPVTGAVRVTSSAPALAIHVGLVRVSEIVDSWQK